LIQRQRIAMEAVTAVASTPKLVLVAAIKTMIEMKIVNPRRIEIECIEPRRDERACGARIIRRPL
jgi:hypothetical protein